MIRSNQKAASSPSQMYFDNNQLTVLSGHCISDKIGLRAFGATLTGTRLPYSVPSANTKQFKTCREVFLKNGDKCTIGQFVITQNPNVIGFTFVARVEEILQIVDSVADYSGFPDGVLLQSADVNRPAVEYHMPHIDLLNHWSFVRFEVCTLSTPHPVTQA
jgi:hypothetical protein